MSFFKKQPLDLTLRRRAAYKTLSEVLQGQSLLQAMWMLEERDHSADKLTFLRIVGVTAETLGIDNKTVSTLYIKLDKNINLPCHLLPPDPMAKMLSLRNIAQEEKPQLSATSSSIFRTNDILGSIENNLDNKTLQKIGLAIASEASKHKCSSIIIARDDRDSSSHISGALIKGLLSTGINVIDLGKIPLPILNFVTHHFDGRAGILISGGHHTSEYNGLKMILAGEILESESIQKIKQRIDTDDFTSTEKEGKLEQNTTFVNEYIGMICEDVQLRKSLVIALEANKNTINKYATELFEALDCKIIYLERLVYKNPSNRKSSFEQHQIDIGFTFDNEGSRLRVFDNHGKAIHAEQLIMLFAKHILKSSPTSQIIHDTYESSNLAILIRQNSGRAVLWKNGSAFMKKQLKLTSAKLAGDIHGHLYFYDRWFGFDDALYAASRLLELLSKDSQSSHEVFSDLPKNSYSLNINLNLKSDENQKIVTHLINSAEFPEGDITNIDGLRVDFKTGWLLIRADPSSSALLIHFEADSSSTLSEMQQATKQMLIKIKPNIQLPF